MKIVIEKETLKNFQTWSGATDTKRRIIDEGKEGEFEALIDEIYPEGLTDTQLNDLLWFESDWIFEHLGITEEQEETEE